MVPVPLLCLVSRRTCLSCDLGGALGRTGPDLSFTATLPPLSNVEPDHLENLGREYDDQEATVNAIRFPVPIPKPSPASPPLPPFCQMLSRPDQPETLTL
jgi:hypothetical protein